MTSASFSMATKEKTLLWINKDVDSKSLSNNENDTPTRQHMAVHLQRLRKITHKPRKHPLLLEHSNIVGWRLRGTIRDVGPVPRLEPNPGAEGVVHLPHCSFWDGRACGCHGHEGETRLANQPNDSHWDPFGCSSVELTSETYRVMQYFEAACSPPALDNPRHNQDQMPYGPVRDLFQQCLSNELHMFAMLATTTGHMKYLTASTVKRSDRPEHFQGKALHLLRQHLQRGSPVTQQIITDIVFLASVEIYNRNFQGAQVLLSLSNSLAFSLGLRRLEHYVGKMCWGSDMFLVSRTVPSPILDLSYEIGPLGPCQSVSVRNHFSATKLVPMGSAFLEQPHIFSPNLLHNIRDIVKLARVVQYLWASSEAEQSIRSWIFARSGALLHRLMSVDFLSLHGSKQDCIRVALIIWLSYLPVSTAGIAWPTSSGIRQNIGLFAAADIRWQIERADINLPHGWAPHENVLLWMLALGVLTACDQAELEWFEIRFLMQCQSLNVKTYERLSALFAHCMWIDHCEEAGGGKLHELLEQPTQEVDPARKCRLVSIRQKYSRPPEGH